MRPEEQKELEQESLNPRCGKKSAGYIEVSKISPKIKETADIGIVKKEEHIRNLSKQWTIVLQN